MLELPLLERFTGCFAVFFLFVFELQRYELFFEFGENCLKLGVFVVLTLCLNA